MLDAGCGFGTTTYALVEHSDSEISDAKPSMPSILHLPCWLDSGRLWMRTRSRTFTSGKPTYLGLRKLPSSWNDYDLILSTSMLEHLPFRHSVTLSAERSLASSDHSQELDDEVSD